MSISASRQVGHFNNAMHHHDGCRLVHPVMWDIEQFRFAFMTDADWCIPPCWSFGISIQFKMSRIDQFVFNSINHSHAINCQTFQISHSQIYFDSLCHNMTISFAIQMNAHKQIFENSSLFLYFKTLCDFRLPFN